MINLVDIFRVFRSVEFLEKYKTNEEREVAVKELQSDGLSFLYHLLGYAFLACVFIVLLKIIWKYENTPNN